MGRGVIFAIVVSVAAGCGGSPTSPGSGVSNVAAQSAVLSTVTQAMSQLALFQRPNGDASNVFTTPCGLGGSMVMTIDAVPSSQPGLYRSASRIEFRDCKNAAGTLNGDPYLETTAEFSFPTLSGTGGDSVSTLRTTGALRVDTNGVVGRVQFDCTTNLTLTFANGSPNVAMTSTGSTTFEQPLGTTPVVRPCGPA